MIRNTPRKIEASQAEVLHIYVDASFDYSNYSGLGGMIVNMSEKVISFFSVEVDTGTLNEIMAKGQKTVVQELEMMAVLAAIKVWKELIKACRVVLFTDSEAVRGTFLKSWSANDDSDRMISVIFQVESDFDAPVWIERVPSQSNPSDIRNLKKEIETSRIEAEMRENVVERMENGKLTQMQFANVFGKLEKMKLWMTRTGEAYHDQNQLTLIAHCSTGHAESALPEL